MKDNNELAILIEKMEVGVAGYLKSEHLKGYIEFNVVDQVESLLLKTIELGASDVHIESNEQIVKVRMRVHGVLREEDLIEKRWLSSIMTRIKVLAGLNIEKLYHAQEGKILFNKNNKRAEFRVSIIPTTFGENAVMRVLSRESRLTPFEDSVYGDDWQWLYDEISRLNSGMVLVCGPTGSGKTTTVYRLLNRLNHDECKIITAEDPVEFQISGVVQVNINSQIGFDFAEAIRSFLRQDPDIIMVGEVRDSKTAEHAIQAALTGHLVFSTVHASEICSVPIRLMDLGVEPYLVAEALDVIVAQRLVSKLCDACKQEKFIHLRGENTRFYEANGCEQCHFTGYLGRMVISEILKVNDAFREAILAKLPINELRIIAIQSGLVPMEVLAKKALDNGTIDWYNYLSCIHKS